VLRNYCIALAVVTVATLIFIGGAYLYTGRNGQNTETSSVTQNADEESSANQIISTGFPENFETVRMQDLSETLRKVTVSRLEEDTLIFSENQVETSLPVSEDLTLSCTNQNIESAAQYDYEGVYYQTDTAELQSLLQEGQSVFLMLDIYEIGGYYVSGIVVGISACPQ
jgi:hypothetical protein